MRKNYQTKQFIRFRRWSRKGYAMFGSLGKLVTIGTLNKSVVEASLNKQQGVIMPFADVEVEKYSGLQEEDTGPLPDVLRELLVLLQPQMEVGKMGCVAGSKESATFKIVGYDSRMGI